MKAFPGIIVEEEIAGDHGVDDDYRDTGEAYPVRMQQQQVHHEVSYGQKDREPSGPSLRPPEPPPDDDEQERYDGQRHIKGDGDVLYLEQLRLGKAPPVHGADQDEEVYTVDEEKDTEKNVKKSDELDLERNVPCHAEKIGFYTYI